LDFWRANGRAKRRTQPWATGSPPEMQPLGCRPRDILKQGLSLVRYQQIKRYLHIYEPQEDALPEEEWFKKVEPLNSNLRRRFKDFYMPPTVMTADEMMARYFGRTHDSTKMPSKPIKQGYKVRTFFLQSLVEAIRLIETRSLRSAPILAIPGTGDFHHRGLVSRSW
jgi:hypothetical protein